MSKKQNLVVYDNTFNLTKLNLITTSQKAVLFAILSKLQHDENVYKSERGNMTTVVSYKDIRRISGLNNMRAQDISDMVDELLNTKLEFFVDNGDGSYEIVKAPMFTLASINSKSRDVTVELSPIMESKMLIGRNEFTIIDVEVISSIRSSYAQELYRLLSQFKATGKLYIGANQWKLRFQPPESYSDYDIIRKQILPAIKGNKPHFKNLKVNIKESDRKLPPTIVFTFDSQEVQSIEESLRKSDTDDKELLEYIKANGGAL